MPERDAALTDAPPLSGVRVIEIGGGIAAAYATRLLSGFGAEVTRIEGFAEGPPLAAAEEIYLLAGKHQARIRAADLRALIEQRDIVVEDGSPHRLESLGLDPVELRQARPDLVFVSVSPFGQSGPYRDYRATNIVTFALGGIMSLTGEHDREPLVSGGSQAQYLAGLHAFAASVTAYFGAAVHGEGDWVDISAQECAAGMLELYGPTTAYGAPVANRLGNQTRAEWGVYPCADGYVGIFALQRQLPALLDAMNDPELADSHFLDSTYRLQHNEELAARIYLFTADKTRQELMDIARRHKVPIGLALTPAQLLDVPSLTERGFWDRIDTDSGVATVPGRPFQGLGWRAPGASRDSGETRAQP
jgi:crotonobetainyl-CoA:carnitine CoA-transferase CaiB-like acyl-CoA transferase